MATVRAQQWAYFLKRLGFPDSKSSIMLYVDSVSDDEVWERFIANNPDAIEACQESKIVNPGDVWWLFGQISYADMRSTFPSRSHGRSIIGPRIVRMKNTPKPVLLDIIQEANRKLTLRSAAYVDPAREIPKEKNLLSDDFVGKRVMHTSFGAGTVIAIKQHNLIVIQFDHCGEKTVSYENCLKESYLSFI